MAKNVRIKEENFKKFMTKALDESKLESLNEAKDFPGELAAAKLNVYNGISKAAQISRSFQDSIVSSINKKTKLPVTVEDYGSPVKFSWDSRGGINLEISFTVRITTGSFSESEIESFIPAKFMKMSNFRNPDVNGQYILSFEFTTQVGSMNLKR